MPNTPSPQRNSLIEKKQYHHYAPSATFTARVAGLPMEILSPLRFTQTIKLIEELFAVEEDLVAEADALSNALHNVIGTITEKQIRQSLILVRRAIFQSKLPKDRDLSAEVWAALPAELAECVRTWLTRVKRRFKLAERGQTVLEAEWQEKRHALQQIVELERFQQGLLLSSRELYIDLKKWLEERATGGPRPDRQLELGLFTFLTRAATKTSPFSTFMGSARGYWTQTGQAFTLDHHWSRLVAVELSWSIAHRIAFELARLPEVRSTLVLRVNPSLIDEGSQLCWLGWRKGETVLRATKTSTLDRILQLLHTLANPTYETLVQKLIQLDEQSRENKVKQYLDHLMKIGLLQLDIGIPDQEFNDLTRLLAWIQGFHTPQIEAITSLLLQVQNCLQDYVTSEKTVERFELFQTIHDTLKTIYHTLGLEKRTVKVPEKYTFYENTLIEGLDLRCSLSRWQQVFTDLACVQEVSALFDWLLPARLGLAAFFIDHYGRDSRVKLLDFYDEYQREIRQPGGWRSEYRISGSHLQELLEHPFSPPVVNVPELEQWNQLRTSFRQQFVGGWENASQRCQIDATEMQSFVASFPNFITPPRSLGFYGQMMLLSPCSPGEEAQPQLVLNSIWSGFGCKEGRLQFLETQVKGQRPPQPYQKATQEEGPLWVDILGVFGSNANLRIAQTPYELTYPGAVSHRPPEEQIPLNDLLVVYNPQSKRLQLFSQQLQRELLPVHMGLLGDLWQPPFLRFLLNVFSDGATNPLLSLMQIPGDPENLSANTPVRACPRISLGSVVLARSSWIVGVQQIPRQEKGTSAFAYMVKLQHWLVTQQLPQECFVRLPTDLLWRPREGDEERLSVATKDHKPFYIDFRNYFSVMLFQQIIHHAERIPHAEEQILLLQEVLPGQKDLWLSDGQARYVSELLIELTRTGEES